MTGALTCRETDEPERVGPDAAADVVRPVRRVVSVAGASSLNDRGLLDGRGRKCERSGARGPRSSTDPTGQAFATAAAARSSTVGICSIRPSTTV